MDLVLAELTLKGCLVYLNDVIVMANTFEQHLERLILVMDRLQREGLKVNSVKYKLFQLNTKFLEHVVSERGVEPDPEKARAVVDWPTPRNLTEARSFVALASYYCRFVGSFVEIARLIHLLIQRNEAFVWKDAQQEAFEHLKQCLATASVLSLPSDEGRYVLDSDASDEALGLILQQEQDGQLKVIAYAKRALQPAERSYCMTRKELLAVVYGLKHFRQFLLNDASFAERITRH